MMNNWQTQSLVRWEIQSSGWKKMEEAVEYHNDLQYLQYDHMRTYTGISSVLALSILLLLFMYPSVYTVLYGQVRRLGHTAKISHYITINGRINEKTFFKWTCGCFADL